MNYVIKVSIQEYAMLKELEYKSYIDGEFSERMWISGLKQILGERYPSSISIFNTYKVEIV